MRADLPLLRVVRTKANATICFRRHNHSASIAVRKRACLMAHPPGHTHGASCVEPDETLVH